MSLDRERRACASAVVHVRDFPHTAHSRNAIVDGNPGGAIAWIGDQLDDLGTAVEGPNPEDRLAGPLSRAGFLKERQPITAAMKKAVGMK